MSFHSILYAGGGPDRPSGQAAAPDFFRDLNLDQIVAAVTAGRQEYDIEGFFYRPLAGIDDIRYRQEIVRDLEDAGLRGRIGAFASQMRQMRHHLRAAEERCYRLDKQGWFLAAVAIYRAAVGRLFDDLTETAPRSRGLAALRAHLADYIGSPVFAALAADTARVEEELRSVRYSLRLHGLAITVSTYDGEADYSAEIEQTFAKFRRAAVKDYGPRFSDSTGFNHVEAQIAEFVAKLHPEIFADFNEYCRNHKGFLEPALVRFDREIQFYVAYLEYIDRLRKAGLPFCQPQVGRRKGAIHGDDVFDLALADRLAAENGSVVVNDFRLEGPERVIIVSGPNQGGKTTFERTFGQLHYLASLGLPVPGSGARLFLCDRILAHFEREERVENLRGKLQDDLLRMRQILDAATRQSLVILNEIFSSTALEDAVFLAGEIMQRILARGCLCVCVTFLDELSALGEAVVSMVSTVVPENPALRTFKLVRRPADGRAYAMAIAEKYRLGYRSLRARLAP